MCSRVITLLSRRIMVPRSASSASLLGLSVVFYVFDQGRRLVCAFICSANTVSRPVTLCKNILHSIWECVRLLHFSAKRNGFRLAVFIYSANMRTARRPITRMKHFMHNLRKYVCLSHCFAKTRGIGLPVFSECVLALNT